MKFRTSQVAALFEETREWSHPEYPFLDANYSPGSYAPAIDLTSYVAEWLGSDHLDAVVELLSFLSYRTDATTFALQHALKARMPSWVKLSEIAYNELRAIYILTMRTMMTGDSQSGPHVGIGLAATTIGSRQVEVEPGFEEELFRVTKSETDKDSLPGSIYGKVEGAKLSVQTSISPLGAAEPAAERLKMVPPMARLVVYDYFTRNWGYGKLNFDLYYGERMYGCGKQHNQRYIDWLGFFCPPHEGAEVPSAVTKDMLREALLQNGISCKKSASRKKMIDAVRSVSGLLSLVILNHCPEYQSIRPDWSESVREWVDRVKYVKPVAAAMLKLMALSVK